MMDSNSLAVSARRAREGTPCRRTSILFIDFTKLLTRIEQVGLPALDRTFQVSNLAGMKYEIDFLANRSEFERPWVGRMSGVGSAAP